VQCIIAKQLVRVLTFLLTGVGENSISVVPSRIQKSNIYEIDAPASGYLDIIIPRHSVEGLEINEVSVTDKEWTDKLKHNDTSERKLAKQGTS